MENQNIPEGLENMDPNTKRSIHRFPGFPLPWKNEKHHLHTSITYIYIQYKRIIFQCWWKLRIISIFLAELPQLFWLVVYLPLWKIWVRQLGWWFRIYGNIKDIRNHQPNIYIYINPSKSQFSYSFPYDFPNHHPVLGSPRAAPSAKSRLRLRHDIAGAAARADCAAAGAASRAATGAEEAALWRNRGGPGLVNCHRTMGNHGNHRFWLENHHTIYKYEWNGHVQ